MLIANTHIPRVQVEFMVQNVLLEDEDFQYISKVSEGESHVVCSLEAETVGASGILPG